MYHDILLADSGGAVFGLIVLMLIGLIIWALVSESQRKHARIAAWRAIAQEFGFKMNTNEFMHGPVDGFDVTADIYVVGSGKNRSTYTRVRVEGGMTKELALGSEGFLSTLLGSDIRTGDTRFDEAVKVQGSEALAMALLDADTREVVSQAVARRWEFGSGTWTYKISGSKGADVRDQIVIGLDLARLFRDGQAKVAQRLAERVASDRSAPVRKRALELLLAQFAKAPETREALRAATGDHSDPVVLLAARALSDVDLLGLLADRSTSEAELRVDALEAMVSLDPRHAASQRVVASWAELDWVQHRTLLLAAVRALATVPHPTAEAVLLRTLAIDDDDLKFESIVALGRIGTIEAVPALAPHRDKLLAFRLKGAAKDAILAIQARATGADAGALALAQEGGNLALTQSGVDS